MAAIDPRWSVAPAVRWATSDFLPVLSTGDPRECRGHVALRTAHGDCACDEERNPSGLQIPLLHHPAPLSHGVQSIARFSLIDP